MGLETGENNGTEEVEDLGAPNVENEVLEGADVPLEKLAKGRAETRSIVRSHFSKIWDIIYLERLDAAGSVGHEFLEAVENPAKVRGV